MNAMEPWLWMLLSFAVLLVVALAAVYALSIKLREAWQQREDRAELHRANVELNLGELRKAVLRVDDRVEQIQVKLEAKAKQDSDLPIGSFLPTEGREAEFERNIRRAEDRFISATGPTRYSPGPLPRSGSRSRRDG